MNTFQLTCFLTLAETLSFAKAARLLNVTQPAVTHQIHSLEEELNAKLFKRTTRSVEITQEGLFLICLCAVQRMPALHWQRLASESLSSPTFRPCGTPPWPTFQSKMWSRCPMGHTTKA